MVELDVKNYLKGEDVKEGDIVTILDEGEKISQEFEGEERMWFEVTIQLGSLEFPWAMNKTTQKRMIEKYGRETKLWIGKKLKLIKVKQNVQGTMRDVIYGIPVQEVIT